MYLVVKQWRLLYPGHSHIQFTGQTFIRPPPSALLARPSLFLTQKGSRCLTTRSTSIHQHPRKEALVCLYCIEYFARYTCKIFKNIFCQLFDTTTIKRIINKKSTPRKMLNTATTGPRERCDYVHKNGNIFKYIMVKNGKKSF